MRTQLRVAALIFHNKTLLTTVMRKNGASYHVLPGGGVEENETIHDALQREIREETGLEIESSRLVYIRELNVKDKGRGVEFYFLVDKYGGEPCKGFDPETKESSFEALEFIDVERLQQVSFHPEQLIAVLAKDRQHEFSGIRHLGLHNYP